MTEPCSEQPWRDEVGCDEEKNPDGVHRCELGESEEHRKIQDWGIVHPCACGAWAVEDPE